MSQLPKDLWVELYHIVGVDWWVKSHVVCKRWLRWADDLSFVRKVFLDTGGHPSQKFDTAKAYKERIFQHLRFAKFLDDPQVVDSSPVDSHFRLSPADLDSLEKYQPIRMGASLEHIGLPDVFLTKVNGILSINNGATGSLLKELPSMDECVYRFDDKPFLARVFQVGHQTFGHNRKTHVAVHNLSDGSCRVSSPIASHWSDFRRIFYLAEVPGFLIQVRNKSLILLDRDSLVIKKIYKFHPDILFRVFMWDKQPYVVSSGKRARFNLTTWELEEAPQELEDVNSHWNVRVGSRNYFVTKSADGNVHPPGSDKPMPVHSARATCIGSRWGDHDYLIFGPDEDGDNQVFRIWRDDDTWRNVRVRELFSRMPTGAVRRRIAMPFLPPPKASIWMDFLGNSLLVVVGLSFWLALGYGLYRVIGGVRRQIWFDREGQA